METPNTTPLDEQAPMEDPLAELERMFIHRYLAEKGIKWCDLPNLPAADVKRLMTEACMYASARLAEIEAKVEFRQEIRYK